ncbi:MAG: HAMP domain-containing methyl-accepting chemotaxis protein [Acidobacteriaceae bacterium]|nr:HAMP domain-containing methyl-accepting chemotaxis protein [Acidobacteriaceae bacterium]
MNLRKLGLKLKIVVGFGSLLVIIAAMGAIGYRSAEVNDQLSDDVRLYSSMKGLTRSLQETLLQMRVGERDILMGRENGSEHLFEHGAIGFNQALEELKPLLSSDEERKLYDRVVQAESAYYNRNMQVLTAYHGGDADGAIAMFKDHDARTVADNLSNSISGMTVVLERQRQEALKRELMTDRLSKTLTLILMLAGLLLGTAITLVISHSILHTIHRMSQMIETVSSNNLVVEDMKVESNDEIGSAAQGLNKMKNSLRRVILSIASTAEDVSRSSQEISATASQAAGSAANQKLQVEQISSTMRQMAATVREISQHSNAAAYSARSAATSAREGGGLVEDVLSRMRGISHSVGESAANIEQLGNRSDEIGRIVGVIDDIAEQTNLLALNAAIEAARAGEQGRGFAVVADEVRRLAVRTAEATKEIAAVIQNVQTMTAESIRQMRLGTAAVEQGVAATGKAGESLQRIIGEVDNVGTMVAQIASAATQQAGVSEEINFSMSQISSLANESADGSQLSSQACEQLFDLALGLQNMVARFQVGQ